MENVQERKMMHFKPQREVTFAVQWLHIQGIITDLHYLGA
jgi:hypothetical protein